MTGDGSLTPEEAVEKHRGLVRMIARAFSKKSREDFEDLMQVGFVGLLEALRRYDSSKSRSTYLVLYIRGAILNHIRDHGHPFNVSRQVQRDRGAPKVPISLNAPAGSVEDEPVTLEYFIGGDDPEFERAEARILLGLAPLTDRERHTLRRYYWDDAPERVIAKELGHSQMHINRIKHKALEKLRGGRLTGRPG